MTHQVYEVPPLVLFDVQQTPPLMLELLLQWQQKRDYQYLHYLGCLKEVDWKGEFANPPLIVNLLLP
jgi:hypothetical protein